MRNELFHDGRKKHFWVLVLLCLVSAGFGRADAQTPHRAASDVPDLATPRFAIGLGGSGADTGNGIAIDSAGASYIVGQTVSGTFDPFAKTLSGSNAFVAKLDAKGQPVYSAFLGGDGDNNLAFAVAVDDTGAAYVAGYTNSKNFPATQGTGSGAFAAKLDPEGKIVYATLLGNPNVGTSIAVNNAREAYVAVGDTIIKLDAAGQVVYAHPLVLEGAAAPVSRILLQENVATPALIAVGEIKTGADVHPFVAKLDDSPTPVYAKILPQTVVPVSGIALANDKLYLTGSLLNRETSFNDSFLAALDSAGNVLDFHSLGGAGENTANAIAADGAGNLYIAGATSSSEFTGGDFGSYAFVLALQPDGTLIDSTTFGSPRRQNCELDCDLLPVGAEGNGIAVDAAGSVILTGWELQSYLGQTHYGDMDALAIKFGSDAPALPTPTPTTISTTTNTTMQCWWGFFCLHLPH